MDILGHLLHTPTDPASGPYARAMVHKATADRASLAGLICQRRVSARIRAPRRQAFYY